MWRTIDKDKKSRFFKIAAARLEIRAWVGKNPGLEFEKKLPGYGILPGCPGRICLVIARFLAGGQLRKARGFVGPRDPPMRRMVGGRGQSMDFWGCYHLGGGSRLGECRWQVLIQGCKCLVQAIMRKHVCFSDARRGK